jgi:hypothetical protein
MDEDWQVSFSRLLWPHLKDLFLYGSKGEDLVLRLFFTSYTYINVRLGADPSPAIVQSSVIR